jgi:hypothetical protein
MGLLQVAWVKWRSSERGGPGGHLEKNEHTEMRRERGGRRMGLRKSRGPAAVWKGVRRVRRGGCGRPCSLLLSDIGTGCKCRSDLATKISLLILVGQHQNQTAWLEGQVGDEISFEF